MNENMLPFRGKFSFPLCSWAYPRRVNCVLHILNPAQSESAFLGIQGDEGRATPRQRRPQIVHELLLLGTSLR